MGKLGYFNTLTTEPSSPREPKLPPRDMGLAEREEIVRKFVYPLYDIEDYVADDPTDDGSWDVTIKSEVLWDVVNAAFLIVEHLLPEHFSREAIMKYQEEG